MAETEKTRIDKYLWSIRLFKTRAQASDACDSGKVKIITEKMGAQAVKASRSVNIGDQYDIKTEGRKWIIKITGIISKRVAYPEAIKNYQDITPQDQLDKITYQPSSFNTGKRLSKIGHPSKRDRRELDDFMEIQAEDTDD